MAKTKAKKVLTREEAAAAARDLPDVFATPPVTRGVVEQDGQYVIVLKIHSPYPKTYRGLPVVVEFSPTLPRAGGPIA